MLTNEQKAGYAADVARPGKFEGEPSYVPYLWDQIMGGGSDEEIDDNGTPVSVCLVTDEDRENFPELADEYAILLHESDQGFVNSRSMSICELGDYREECERSEDDDPTEPEDDDYVLSSCGPLGGKTRVSQSGRNLGEFVEESDAREFVRSRMEAEQFWPNVWVLSDHGNYHLTTIVE